MSVDDYLEEDEGPRQPPLYLITGLVLGLGLGLLISLVLSPIRYVDTSPSSLAAEYKDNYRLLIAQAYQADGDLARARQRLSLLGDADLLDSLTAQAQQMVSSPEGEQAARQLAALAAALSAPVTEAPAPTGNSGAVNPGGALTTTPQPFTTLDISQAVQTATPVPSATSTPQPTFTPRQPTQAPTLDAPFQLQSQQSVCDASLPPGLMQIELVDASGQPVPGVQINVAWDGGLDTFYTGLHPSIDAGYADFQMTADVSYSLRIGGVGDTLDGLIAPTCTGDSSSSYTGGLSLMFMQEKP